MPNHPDVPHPQTSAPAPPARTPDDASPGEGEEERTPRREAGDATGEHGDRMPKGADEPGAGL
jgi:hypothetical protein